MSTNQTPQTPPASSEDLPLADSEHVDAVCGALIAAWRRGERPRLETLVGSSPPSVQLQLASELIRTELELLRGDGEFVPLSEMLERFPQWSRELGILLKDESNQPLGDGPRAVAVPSFDGNGIGDGNGTPQIGPTSSANGLRNNGSVPSWPPLNLGPYDVCKVLSDSSFAMTCLARDAKTNSDVVIKIQSPKLTRIVGAKEQFLRAARAATSLRHKNIVAVHEVKEVEGVPFLVMEYVHGTSLAERLRLPTPLQTDEIIWIGRQVAAALHAAHQRGTTHGSINPQNVLLERDNSDGPHVRVKVINFGMCRVATESGIQPSTANPAVMSFQSPEQVLKLPIDHRSDLFSLGALLYALIARRDPFVGDSPADVHEQIVNSEPPRLRDSDHAVPASLVRVIERLMLKRRDDRFQTADGVVVALGNSSTPIESPASTHTRWRRIGGFVVVAAALSLAAFISEWPRSSSPTFQNAQTFNDRAKAQSDNSSQQAAKKEPALATASAPFNIREAQGHQVSWAGHLRVPREWTNSIGMRFVLIPPGEYTRGIPAEANTLFREYFPKDTHMQECFDTQSPPHRVVISNAFYLSVNEVTQGQYSAIAERNPATFSSQGPLRQAVEGQNTSELPVETVSWNDAVLFCRRLSEREGYSLSYTASDELLPDGKGYRLPSDAEWEYACRAGTQTRHSNGDSDEELREVGWTSSQAGNEAGADAPPHAVGQLKSNAFGLNDMHGNLWEWCHDWYSTSYYREFVEPRMVDPFGPAAGPTRERVIRGGYYHGPPYRSHSANRDCCRTDLGFHHIGFRVLLSVEGVRAVSLQTARNAP